MRFLILALTIVCAHVFADGALGADGKYSVAKDDRGVWWFVAPDGGRFYSLGINNVNHEAYMPRAGSSYYRPVEDQFKGDVGAWAASTKALLTDHGFNTLGAWSTMKVPAGEGLHRTYVLYVVLHEGTRCLTPLRPDFEEFVRVNTRDAVAKLTDRKALAGVFLDNEMPWFGKSGWDEIPTYTLLEHAFTLPAKDPMRIATMDWLKKRYGTVDKLAAAYHVQAKSWDDIDGAMLQRCAAPAAMADRDAFTEMLAKRFFEVTTKIAREELPGVLLLGTRIPGNAPDSVIKECGKHCDVMSVNTYDHDPKVDESRMTRFWLLGGRPIMLTEYAWRAKENSSGCPNTRGAGGVVETQSERAAAYTAFNTDLASIPYVIGSHWFEFADQSPQGRFDGEDSNYGVVDIQNRPYAELLGAMKQTNTRVRELHASTKRVMPSEMPKAGVVTYQPGQHPERPATLELISDWTHEPEIWGAPDASMKWQKRGTDLVLSYEAGAQYGAGINIFGPKISALGRGPKWATDLDGYSTIVIEADAPKGIQMTVVIAEAGAAPPSTPKFDTSGGDDGEGYASAPFYGEGKMTTYRLPIAGFLRQKFFGNQSGKMRIDMQAIRNVGLQAQGQPSQGEIVVKSFRLEK